VRSLPDLTGLLPISPNDESRRTLFTDKPHRDLMGGSSVSSNVCHESPRDGHGHHPVRSMQPWILQLCP